MKKQFLYAKKLNEKYKCYGHFYEINFNSITSMSCRSVLEIVDKSSIPEDICSLAIKIPDVIFVMMNPGSSYPLEPTPTDSKVRASDFLKKKKLVLTRPDNTQYQVMRVGIEMGWSHLRVLNLSDLRNSKSKLFLDNVESLSNFNNSNMHSIFGDERIHECKKMLLSKSKIIIIGWGQNQRLLPLAKSCFKRFKSQKIISVESKLDSMLTLHPSPMLQVKKEEWLNCIIKQLKK